MRQSGFYWVKRLIVWHGPPRKEEIVWEVAKYEYGQWHLADNSIAIYSDKSFLEIDERRITRERPPEILIERTCRDDWPGTKTIDLGGGLGNKLFGLI